MREAAGPPTTRDSWFFLGLLFAPLTGLVLLYQDSKDRESAHRLSTVP